MNRLDTKFPYNCQICKNLGPLSIGVKKFIIHTSSFIIIYTPLFFNLKETKYAIRCTTQSRASDFVF
jgi:hypothetical protein